MARSLLLVLTVSLALAGSAAAAPDPVERYAEHVGTKLRKPPRPYFGRLPRPHTEPPTPRSRG